MSSIPARKTRASSRDDSAPVGHKRGALNSKIEPNPPTRREEYNLAAQGNTHHSWDLMRRSLFYSSTCHLEQKPAF